MSPYAYLPFSYGKKSYVTKGFVRLALEPTTHASHAQRAAALESRRGCSAAGAPLQQRRGRGALKRARSDGSGNVSIKQQRLAAAALREKKRKLKQQQAIDDDAAVARELQRELGGLRNRRTRS